MMLWFYVACLLYIFVFIGLLLWRYNMSIWRFLLYIKEDLLIVLGTSSSESVLPAIMDKLERAGCNRSVVRLVIPTGYSFNLDGTAIYLTMASVFLAQAINQPMGLGEQLFLVFVLTITSNGAAGVTGSGWQKFITQNIDLSRAANNLDSAAYVKYGLRQEAQFEFMVCQDGEICDIKLLNADKISPDFAKEALRVMRRSPKWTPGLIDGKPVRTRFRQAIVAFFDN